MYRKNVGIVIQNPHGQVLLFERADIPGAWQFCQGGQDEGETPLQTALREAEEETGIPASELEYVAEHPHWLRYDFPSPQAKARHAALGYVGQQQKWLLFTWHPAQGATAGACPVPDVLNAATPEFRSAKWVSPPEAAAQTAPFRQAIYQTVLADFKLL